MKAFTDIYEHINIHIEPVTTRVSLEITSHHDRLSSEFSILRTRLYSWGFGEMRCGINAGLGYYIRKIWIFLNET